MNTTDFYERQARIPEWNQSKLANLSIGLVGLGGLGACVLESLVLMGIGEAGTTVLIDPDTITQTNLSRLPYATFEDLDKSKVSVAAQWARRLRPGRCFRGVNLDLLDPAAQVEVMGCQLIIGATDSQLARHVLVHLAREFMGPLVDGGSGIHISRIGDQLICVPGGQVRLFSPGTTPCLHCCLGIDQGQVNAELARRRAKSDPAFAEMLVKAGYLQGNATENVPEPSVHFVNSVVGALIISVIKDYVLTGVDDTFAGIAVDLATPSLNRLTASHGELCPYCGPSAIIGGGAFYQESDETIVPRDVSPMVVGVTGASLLEPSEDDEEAP